jgi:hypothetical protein
MAGIMTRMSQSNKSQHIRIICVIRDETNPGTSLPLTGVNRLPQRPS